MTDDKNSAKAARTAPEQSHPPDSAGLPLCSKSSEFSRNDGREVPGIGPLSMFGVTCLFAFFNVMEFLFRRSKQEFEEFGDDE